MPGTFVVRPIEANLTHNTDFITKMSPYCSFVVGNNKIDGQICKKGGKHPHWNDAVTLPATGGSKVLVELMDKDKITHDDHIGNFMLDLNEAQVAGQVSKWYPLTYKNKPAGEILMEVTFQPDSASTLGGQGQQYYQQNQYTTGGLIGQNQHYQGYRQEKLHTTAAQPTLVEQNVIGADTSNHSHVWTEQKQIVEPHKFVKEVEVVETRPATKEIEVMEPVKVLKEVPYTQAVPVKKQIEVMEPQVVTKEVEVIEPRLVTKTIQVVENVPVIRKVEVVEMRNAIQEVETVEPQTFTKQVEVTEYVPVKKAVEVTQPVTLKKAVEFVEPVITTQTITKEVQQPVIINEEVTTTVGPASVVGISQEYGYMQQYGEISLSERQRLSGLKRWIGFERLFGGLTEQERLFEQQRLSRLSEEEWLREQQRLAAFSEQERLAEQRRLYNSHFNKSTGAYSSHHGSTSTSTGHKRWHGLERLFGGLNEKERLFEQERWNRLSEEEWLREQQRLSAFSEQERLLEQRRLYNDYLQTGGYSTYKKTTETIEKTTTPGGQSGQSHLGGFNSNLPSNTYHPSPNF